MQRRSENSGPSTEGLLDLVGQIYTTALYPDKMEAALDTLSGCLGATFTQSYIYQPDVGEVIDAHISHPVLTEEHHKQYTEEWSHVDPRPARAAMLPSGSVMLCHEQFDDKYVARSAFYQEYFIPIGLRWAMGATYHRADGTSVIVAGLRAPDLPHFSRRDARTLQLVMPHFCRALDLRTNLDAHLLAGSHVESILHALNQPALILDSDGKVLAANELAVGALQETLVRSRGGCLSFESSESHYAWREAISVAARTGTARALSIRLGATRCIRARLVPLKQLGVAADERERRMMLATFSREDGQTADVSSFVDEFGLSRAESEVLEQLLNGSVAKQIASHRNTSLNTVRMQIRTLLQKTGARSQRELLLRCSSPISRLCGRIRTDAQ